METIRWILSITGMLGFLGLFISVPIGIVFLVKASNTTEQESEKKKSLKKKGIFFVVLPIILSIGSLISLVIITTINELNGGNF